MPALVLGCAANWRKRSAALRLSSAVADRQASDFSTAGPYLANIELNRRILASLGFFGAQFWAGIPAAVIVPPSSIVPSFPTPPPAANPIVAATGNASTTPSAVSVAKLDGLFRRRSSSSFARSARHSSTARGIPVCVLFFPARPLAVLTIVIGRIIGPIGAS